MSAAEVTVLGPADTAAASDLARLLAQVSSRSTGLTTERVCEVLQSPATSVLVARLDGEIVGMALLLTLTTFAASSGYVEEVVVDEAARGRHVASALMKELLRLAARKGLAFVDLTSRPSRAAANGLYQSLGFTLRPTNSYRYDLNQKG